MNSLWTVLLPLAEKAPDPEDVKPGWVALVLFLLLAAAVVLLAFSLVKHLRKARANFDERDGVDDGDSPPPERPGD